MPDKPMKFCARQTSCRDAYTVGAPGTVKIAHDSAPVDEKIVNEVLTILYAKLSEEDYAKVANLMDSLVDKAEALNPTKAMASDGLSPSTRRIVRQVRRNTMLGFDAPPPGLMTTMAADQAELNATFPHRNRLNAGNPMGYVQPTPLKPSRPRTAAERAEYDAAFPHANRLGR